MQCPSCLMKWDASASKSQFKIEKCPFCGASLVKEEAKQYGEDTIEGVLQSIVSQYGKDIYNNVSRLNALLTDLAIGFDTERKRIKIAGHEDISKKILNCDEQDDGAKESCLQECKYLLIEDCGMNEQIASEIVSWFAAGLSWNVTLVDNQTSKEEDIEALYPLDKAHLDQYSDVIIAKARLRCPQNENDIYDEEIRKRGIDKLVDYANQTNDAEVQLYLGICYEDEIYVKQDYAEAVKWYRKSAEQGNSGGQNGLGRLYYEGYGVPQNYNEAVKWFRKSAEQGNSSGQFNLGCMYHEGYGVPQNYNEAVKWFRKSAEQGNEQAINILSQI